MRRPILVLVLLAAGAVRASAITPDKLPPNELKRYNALKASKPADADAYLATRGYVHQAEEILMMTDQKAKEQAALNLRRPKNLDEKFLLAEDVDHISAVLDLGMNALVNNMVV